MDKAQRIEGIKAIAGYLQVDKRTVYRWEKLGLPLRRVAGIKGKTVYAFKEELDQWFKSRGKDSFNKNRIGILSPIRIATIILIIIIIISLGYFFIFQGRKSQKTQTNPMNAELSGNVIHIKNLKGETLWSDISFEPGINFDWDAYKAVAFCDIDSDGLNEVIMRTYQQQENHYYINFFDHDGRLSWKRDIKNERRFNQALELRTDFFPLEIIVARSKNKKPYFVTHWRHRPRFLSLISRHDLNGNLLNKYSQVGQLSDIRAFDLRGDGDEEIVFSGTNNLLNGEAVLGILPLSSFKGFSPPYQIESEFKDDAFRLKDYVSENPLPGNQLSYIRFRKTGHLEKYDFSDYHSCQIDNIADETLDVKLYIWNLGDGTDNFGFYYTLNPELDVSAVIPSAYLRKYYPEFVRSEETNISLEQLTSIYSSIIFKWQDGSWVQSAYLPSVKSKKLN